MPRNAGKRLDFKIHRRASMMRPVKLFLPLAICAAALAAPAAAASNFTLVNGTGESVADLQIRRTGAQSWRVLGPAPAPGASIAIPFGDVDCAFDITARLDRSGTVTWRGVNLCDVAKVTLRNDPQAGPWIDYDAP